LTSKDIDRMKNKPSLWMLTAGAIALIAMVAYLFFALTLADHMQPDPIPAGKAAATQSPM
jgi:hypothetical protein